MKIKISPVSLTLLFLLAWIPALAQQRFTLSGFVIEHESGEKLSGALISVNSANIITHANEYGFYSLSLPLGEYTIRVAFPGSGDTIYQVSLNQDLSMNLALSPSYQIEEVKVVASAKSAAQTNMGTYQIDVAQIKNVPSLLGEKDVLKFIKLLPGVQKGQEGSSGFNVRGGGTDQNLIILDDAVVYNASHLFGFFSTFNGEALKNVAFIKGGYSAKYGGRLSSVLNMTMKDGNKQEYKGEYGIGLLSSRLMLEGPVLKDKISFLVSARRSYADIIANPIIRHYNDGLSMGYYFYDFNAKLNYKIDDKNDLFLSGYFGRDKFYSRAKDNYELSNVNFGWGNVTGTLRWNHIFKPKLFSNLTVNYSNYKMQIGNWQKIDNVPYSLSYLSAIEDLGAKVDFTYYGSINNTLRFGYQFTHHFFKPNAIVEKEAGSTSTNGFKIYESYEHNFYVDDEWFITKKWAANMGARLSTFSSEGKTYAKLEPRISSRIMVGDASAIKANYTVMNQYMHLLTSTGIGLPTDLWVPASSRIKPQTARQYSLGFFSDFQNADISMSIEGYYKQMQNVIAYKEGASFMIIDDFTAPEVENVPFEENITTGNGKSYGAELMLKKNKGRFSGWASYTLAWTKYRMAEINGGHWYYPHFDRRNDLSLVGFYQLSPKIKINALFTLASGNPIYLPVYDVNYVLSPNPDGSMHSYTQTKSITEYSKRNEYRAETYHRMDIGIQFIKQKKRGLRTWEISFYNIYNRQNPFFYNVESKVTNGLTDTRLYKYTVFPFIPSITYAFKF